MKIFIDSSIFLKLFLDEVNANKAQELLEAVETNKLLGYTTPIVLEEIMFKLIFAKASDALGTSSIWKIRKAILSKKKVKEACITTINTFLDYVEYMTGRGLRIEHVTYEDWRRSIEFIERYGLLPADALHLAVALRIKADAIATFDEDFKRVKEVNIIP